MSKAPIKLSKHTVDALSWKATVLEDTVDVDDPETVWAADTAAICRKTAQEATVNCLATAVEAQRELEDYIGGDMKASECRAIQVDLCHSGWYTPYDKNSVSTRRLPTLTIDGVKYEG